MTTLTIVLSLSIACVLGIFLMSWMALAVSKYIYLRNAHWDLCRQIYKTSSDADSYDADISENILRYAQIKNKGAIA